MTLFYGFEWERCDVCERDFDPVTVVSVWLPMSRELVTVCEACAPPVLEQQEAELATVAEGATVVG